MGATATLPETATGGGLEEPDGNNWEEEEQATDGARVGPLRVLRALRAPRPPRALQVPHLLHPPRSPPPSPEDTLTLQHLHVSSLSLKL